MGGMNMAGGMTNPAGGANVNMSGMNMNMNMMGPPSGMPAQHQHQQQQHSSGGMNGFAPMPPQIPVQRQMNGSPRPMSASGMGMSGMGMNTMGVPPPAANMNVGIGMNAGMGMGGIGMGHPTMPPGLQQQGRQNSVTATPFHPQMSQQHASGSLGVHARPQMPQSQQSLMMGQGVHPGDMHQQQQIRQVSLPPSAGGIPPQIGGMKQGSMPPSRIPSVVPPISTVPPGHGMVVPPPLAASSSTGSIVTASPLSNPNLPPLPANVNLNPAVSRVTIVPLIDSDKTIPALNEEEIKDIQSWMKIDKEYEGVYRKMKERMNDELRSDARGPLSVRWWEQGAPSVNPGLAGGRFRRGPEPFGVRYPRSRKDRELGRGRKAGRREGLRL